MDDLLTVVVAVLTWRFLLSASAALALAVYLAHTLPWFSGPMGIVVLLAGSFAGWAWQETSCGVPLLSKVPDRPISNLVTILTFAFFGAVWGVLGSNSPAHAAGLLAAVSLLVGGWYALILKRRVQPRLAAVSTCSMFLGFSAAVAYVLFNG